MSRQKCKAWDKILPDQSANNHLYMGDTGDYHASLFQLISRTCGIDSPEMGFRLQASDRFTIEEMASNLINLRFLEFLIRQSGCRHVLEIGCFIGLSALTMARALPEDGRVQTIEKFDEFADIAEANFASNGYDEKISLWRGDAFIVMDGFDDAGFDFVFVDGNKERYADYVEKAERLVAPGGLIVIDDVLFHGDALNDKPSTDKGCGVRQLLEMAAGRADFHRTLLPIGNGVLVLEKKVRAA